MPTPLETVAIGGYDVKAWHVALLIAVAVVVALAGLRYGPSLWRRFRALSVRTQVASVLGTLAVVVVAALVIEGALDRPGDLLDEDAEFRAGKRQKVSGEQVRWPVYGYDDERSRYLATDFVKPPYSSSLWSWNAGKLLEFSPIAVGDRLYVIDKDATVVSLNAGTGKVDWKTDLGNLNASSPAYADGKVYGVSLAPGQAFGLRADTGKVDWRTPLGARSETSPVVYGDTVLVGAESGKVFALDVKEGKVKWTVDTGGAVKGGIAIHDGIAYFGNYAGELWAVRASNGDVKWRSGTQGASLGRVGSIYSTPAVAFGRVYVGAKDGRVYSFVEDSGALAWSQSTGDEVYPAPAVADPPGAGPTVFVGSLDQMLYAMDAEDGDIRWRERVGGPVIGAATVLGSVVYVAGIGPRIGTVGFDVADGSREFEHELGEYNPVISDGRRLYLTGSSQLRAFEPKSPKEIRHARQKEREREEKLKRRERRRERLQKQRAERRERRADRRADRQARRQQRREERRAEHHRSHDKQQDGKRNGGKGK